MFVQAQARLNADLVVRLVVSVSCCALTSFAAKI